MNQPTDRLGQPLSVGDWVVIDGPHAVNDAIGIEAEILWFESPRYKTGATGVFIADPRDGLTATIDSTSVRKINPKPETTTWDKCVFVPEGVSV